MPEATRATVDLPVLVATTYSPDWRARDGRQVYAATPFFMLTFARGPVHLVYSRSTLDRAGLWASGLALLALCCFAFIPRRESSRDAGREKADALRRVRRAGEFADERIVS
jgi:hypothetical protein